MLRLVPLLPIAVIPAAALAGDLDPAVDAVARSKIPEDWPQAPGETSGTAEDGRWEIRTGEMNGAGSPEVFVVILPDRHKGEVHFVAERLDDDPEAKKVKLAGNVAGHCSVSFHAFGQGRHLAHVDATPAGQLLLHWDGEKLRTVWKVGKTRDDESHWFNTEDLDGDGTMEVITFFRRQLDVFYADEDDLGEQGGADPSSAGQVDAVAVYRLEDGRWKENEELLDSLR